MSEQSDHNESVFNNLRRLFQKQQFTPLDQPPAQDVIPESHNLEDKHYRLIGLLRAVAQTEGSDLDVNQQLEVKTEADKLAEELGLIIRYNRLVHYDKDSADFETGHKAIPKKATARGEVIPSTGRGCLMEFEDPALGVDFHVFDMDNPKDLPAILANELKLTAALSKRRSYKLPLQPIVLAAGKPISKASKK